MVLSSLAHYRGPLRPHHSPRRAAHRPASHSPRAAHRACLRLRRRYLRLMSKVRSRWGYALQCPPCPKLLGWCGWVRKIDILSLLSLSLASLPLQRDEPSGGPLQPKMPDARKTCSSCSTFSCTPTLAACPATSEVAPVSTVPSVSPHSPAEPTPVSTSVAGFTSASGALPHDSRAPPQLTSSLKRALGRGILWRSQVSPATGALSDHISVQGERRTAPPVSVRRRRTAPVSASAADTCGSCPRYEAGGATPRSVLRA